MPPPSTKSNSSRPVFQRAAFDSDDVAKLGVRSATFPPSASDFTPPMRRAAPPSAAILGATISSTSVFHSPQVSQRPCHLKYSAPHSVQW